MSKRVCVIFLLGCMVPGLAAAAKPPREVTDEDVDRVMGETARFLWAQQAPGGLWRHHHHALPAGGPAALAMFALLEAGESHNDPRMIGGLEALTRLKTNNLYVIAMRVMVLSQIVAGHRNSPHRRQLEKDLHWLAGEALRKGGAWGYAGPEAVGDNSCSQFALLALWEADRAGVRINPRLIGLVQRTWLRRQQKDGGWTYPGQPDVTTASTLTMTTAGLASLFICQDVLTNTCRPYPNRRQTDAGWKYLADHLKNDYFRNGYLAFCVQRVGMASGRKFIAGMDWFATGAAKLAEPNPRGRGYAGPWGPVVRAAFELIFLARGRIPLTFNKLAHGPDEADWNFHTRDVPHFTEYMRRNFERRLRWQIVKITDDTQRLLDAPILLVTGKEALGFTPGQWQKLGQYTLRGGTLLMVPSHNSEAFLASAKARLSELYAPQRRLARGGRAETQPATAPAGTEAGELFTLRPLAADHPIYRLHQKIPAGPTSAPMWGVSDGTRLLAVVCKRDIACCWHRRALATGKLDYMLGVNFFLYATGANAMRMRLRPVFAGAAGEVRHRARLARVRYDGNWRTQPYALDYLSAKLTAENRVAIEVTDGAALQAERLAGHHLAWMTGHEAFSLGRAEIAALRSYLDGGGTLFINAVGGSRPFDLSARQMLEQLFAGREVLVIAPGPASPLVTGKCGEFRGPPLGKLDRTRAWRMLRPRAGLQLKLYEQHGRAVVIYAPYGIHDTLDGHTAHGAQSYMPPAARDIAANIVLYALMAKPTAPAGSQPSADGAK